jgi:hypothetical protein
MRTLVALLIATGLCGAPFHRARADDQALANLVDELKHHPNTPQSPISLTAIAAAEGRGLVLRFHLTNISTRTLTFYEPELPWGQVYSISWAALTPDRRVLPVGYPISDVFSLGAPIRLDPGKSLDGTYHLDWMLDPKGIPADTDLAILWLYRPRPSTTSISSDSTASGVAYVHTPK